MSKDVQQFESLQEEAPVTVAGRVEPQLEDMYWEDAFHTESYFTPGFDFEDYAPAYCVGYVGFAQYGGSFDDAEKALCSNWMRIKGDSRLSYEQALPAMRAAWMRMAASRTTPVAQPVRGGIARKLSQLRRHVPSVRLPSPAFAR